MYHARLSGEHASSSPATQEYWDEVLKGRQQSEPVHVAPSRAVQASSVPLTQSAASPTQHLLPVHVRPAPLQDWDVPSAQMVTCSTQQRFWEASQAPPAASQSRCLPDTQMFRTTSRSQHWEPVQTPSSSTHRSCDSIGRQ